MNQNTCAQDCYKQLAQQRYFANDIGNIQLVIDDDIDFQDAYLNALVAEGFFQNMNQAIEMMGSDPQVPHDFFCDKLSERLTMSIYVVSLIWDRSYGYNEGNQVYNSSYELVEPKIYGTGYTFHDGFILCSSSVLHGETGAGHYKFVNRQFYGSNEELEELVEMKRRGDL